MANPANAANANDNNDAAPPTSEPRNAWHTFAWMATVVYSFFVVSLLHPNFLIVWPKELKSWFSDNWGIIGMLYIAIQVLPLFVHNWEKNGKRDLVNFASALPLIGIVYLHWAYGASWGYWEWNIAKTAIIAVIIDVGLTFWAYLHRND